MLVNAESIDEILADKVVAFPASVKNIRYRDIWDIAWLRQQGAQLDPALVERKVDDYHIEGYARLLENAAVRLPGVIEGKPFLDQMSRFIDAETVARTLQVAGFAGYLRNTVGQVFDAMSAHLHGKPDDRVDRFRM